MPFLCRVSRLFHLTPGCAVRITSCRTGRPHKLGFHRAASPAVKSNLMHIPGLFCRPVFRFVGIGAAVKMIRSLLFNCIIRRQDTVCRTARKLCLRGWQTVLFD